VPQKAEKDPYEPFFLLLGTGLSDRNFLWFVPSRALAARAHRGPLGPAGIPTVQTALAD
jgi:hypothetical protein